MFSGNSNNNNNNETGNGLDTSSVQNWEKEYGCPLLKMIRFLSGKH